MPFFKKVKFIVILFSLSITLSNCYEELIPPEVNVINIEYPLGKKAIYAVGYYTGNPDSLVPEYIKILSLQFNSHTLSNNIDTYNGYIEEYGKSFQIEDSIQFSAEYSGEVTLTVDDKWMLFQYGSFIGSSDLFLKRTLDDVDTTLLPTIKLNQFPLFPKSIIPNKAYSVYRPANDSTFIGVQRNMNFLYYDGWNDIYGNEKGIYYTTEHIIKDFNFTLNLRGFVDSHGIITSSSAFELGPSSSIVSDSSESRISYRINRRIVDFTEPENLNELSWYVDYVFENGLKYLKEE